MHFTVLYKEYRSLKSKAHVGGGKRHFEKDSNNSVFGVHLNKGRPFAGKKSLIFTTNSKALSWNKHHGWTTVQSTTDDSKKPKSEYRDEVRDEVSEVLKS